MRVHPLAQSLHHPFRRFVPVQHLQLGPLFLLGVPYEADSLLGKDGPSLIKTLRGVLPKTKLEQHGFNRVFKCFL